MENKKSEIKLDKKVTNDETKKSEKKKVKKELPGNKVFGNPGLYEVRKKGDELLIYVTKNLEVHVRVLPKSK